MSIDENFETYIRLSIQKVLTSTSGLSGIPIQLFGLRAPMPETVRKWYALDILAIPRKSSRRGVWLGMVLFQVTCFARDAADASDLDANSAQRLVGVVARALEQKHMAIITYGVTPLVTICTMAVSPPNMVSIPPIKGTNTSAVAATFTGYIQSS